MRAIPQAALALVKTSEGFRAERNTDPSGYAEIGYGHKMTRNDPLWNATLSEEAAGEVAEADMELVAQELGNTLGAIVTDILTEGQWAAILDFTFNEGIGRFEGSTLCRLIRLGQMQAVASEFGRWVYANVGGQEVKLDGLVTRRAAEAALWSS